MLTFSHLGYAKRMDPDNFRVQNRGGKGIKGTQNIENDYVEDMITTHSHAYVLFFTNMGKVYRLKAYEIPGGLKDSPGTALVNILSMQQGEHPTAIITIDSFDDDKYLIMATKGGMIKRTPFLL